MARTPDHYRMKAAENRTIAEGVGDNRARIALLSVAEQYEALARQAEAREQEGLA